jgi:hypothetical protein
MKGVVFWDMMDFYSIGYWGGLESESAVRGLSISRKSVGAERQVVCIDTHVNHSVLGTSRSKCSDGCA